jgi:hypothetical protein
VSSPPPAGQRWPPLRPVAPPATPPLSSKTHDRPRRLQRSAAEQPAMPAPITTMSAVAGRAGVERKSSRSCVSVKKAVPAPISFVFFVLVYLSRGLPKEKKIQGTSLCGTFLSVFVVLTANKQKSCHQAWYSRTYSSSMLCGLSTNANLKLLATMIDLKRFGNLKSLDSGKVRRGFGGLGFRLH